MGSAEAVTYVRSNQDFRATVQAVAADLGVNESAMFRSGVVALITAHPDVSDEHKRALAKANARIRSFFVNLPLRDTAAPLSTTGEG
ncbi:hypothetical protein IQ216_09440 [Cyanobium sp. LEGE 06143]|uniref:hypothetical protein n=1 Tax=Cyanobium sp. LEGE 06143 TaxID=945727 RepID=UPI001882DDE4|nr:hypothetical protein [Cyanobium sp. LEGE 06143]MBE9173293.1 hypothetical protein [Cyanobium sp. LEGE 06143]